MEEIKGFVEKVVFQNEENGYAVIELDTKDGMCTCRGIFATIREGEYLLIKGEWTEHPRYGMQFQMQSYDVQQPEDKDATFRYLASGAIKGIGSAMAKKIVDEFGDDSFRILEEEPLKLAQIKGISKKMALEFGAQVRSKKDTRDGMIFLQQYGISTNLALKIYKEYGIEVYGIMKENPYRLARDIEGVGFKMADEIARKSGISPDSEFRIESGIVYTLLQESVSGHICYPMELLKEKACELLEIGQDIDLDVFIANLVIDRRLVVKNMPYGRMVYLPYFYYTELEVATKLAKLNEKYNINEEKILGKLEKIQKRTGIVLDENQKRAVVETVKNGIVVITGGPGTGKTTTINAIIGFFESEGYEIRLAAPTGRAAKRMSEATKYDAQTIHRLLEVSGNASESNTIFGRDEDNPIEADVIVVDEMSMVDISLMKSLLSAVSQGTRLVLVGDVNQLPSVGPGNVLKDIIDSEEFKVVKLTRIFRQDEESDIVVNAHKINEGQNVDLNKPSKDFLCVKREAINIFGAMTTLIKDKLSNYVGVTPYEVQVLTPTRVGQFGSVRLNELLQQQLNPPETKKREKIYGEYTFREGDKVMQVKNNYQLEWSVSNRYGFVSEVGTGVFNGDVGIISEINTFSNEVTVEFEHEENLKKKVIYTMSELSELELAYAITIHKSQGSEYPAVIIPLASGPKKLMSRNLIYTAVTRAKNCVCMVGMPEVFYEMVENDKEQERYSTLKERINEVFRSENTINSN